MRVFHKDGDFDAFAALLAEAKLRCPMRILAYCLMPNHFHLALWPICDGDLGRWGQKGVGSRFGRQMDSRAENGGRGRKGVGSRFGAWESTPFFWSPWHPSENPSGSVSSCAGKFDSSSP